jgi:hypothetical protein
MIKLKKKTNLEIILKKKIVIKRMRVKFKILKNLWGMKLKKIFNFFNYSK